MLARLFELHRLFWRKIRLKSRRVGGSSVTSIEIHTNRSAGQPASQRVCSPVLDHRQSRVASPFESRLMHLK